MLKSNSLYLAVIAAGLLGAGSALCQIQFERITTGEVATDVNTSWGVSWADYDGDGWVDLFVGNGFEEPNCLYHNNGDGTFAKITSGSIPDDGGDSGSGIWVDFDNDGALDLFVSNYDPPNDFFYHNEGSGVFTRLLEGDLVNNGLRTAAASSADFDQDGWLDLFVAAPHDNSLLYRDNGADTLERVREGAPVTNRGTTISGSWVDYDSDGDQDLYVANAGTAGQRNFLHRNEGGGEWTEITEGPQVTDIGVSQGGIWGDYDNDGDFDLFDPWWFNQNNALYRNDGNGVFTSIVDQPMVMDGGNTDGAVWADFDNDGYIDLFVANGENEDNRLYRNQRDGTFVEILEGSLPWDGGKSAACAVGDYDNDGYLDLYVANGGGSENSLAAEPNFLYHNADSGNSWIIIRLIGTVSNRSAVGAKVRVQAVVWGSELRQLRQVAAGEGYYIQNDLRVHFGLGDAIQVDVLRIEWPSGVVQELRNVNVNQILPVTEPARLIAQSAGQFQIQSWVGQDFDVQVACAAVAKKCLRPFHSCEFPPTSLR